MKARFLALVMVLLVVGVLGPTSAGGAEPRPRGIIVFVSERGGSRQLYTIRADGSDLQGPLTNFGRFTIHRPAVSPDGSRIAFSAYDFTCVPNACVGEAHIWVIGSDGSGLTQVTNAPGTTDWEPGWTPDGKTIVFSRDQATGLEWGDLYAITETSPGVWTEELFLSRSGAEGGVAFSPDGRWLVYTYVVDDDRFYNEGEDDYAIENSELIIAKADGSQGRRVKLPASEDAQATWSPDSKRIAFTRWRIQPDWAPIGVWTVRRDGTNVRQLIKGPDASEPTWSGDEDSIFYQRCYHPNEDPYRCAIFRFDITTRSKSVFEDVPGIFDAQPHFGGWK